MGGVEGREQGEGNEGIILIQTTTREVRMLGSKASLHSPLKTKMETHLLCFPECISESTGPAFLASSEV